MTISIRCRALVEQAKLMAKSLHCRANADARAAALKAASVYVMAAGWSETMEPAALAERCREQGNAYLASAKPYKAGPKRSAYVRGAAALFEVARWAEEEGQPITIDDLRAAQAQLPQDDDMPAIPSNHPIGCSPNLIGPVAGTGRLPRRTYTRRTPPAQDSTEE